MNVGKDDTKVIDKDFMVKQMDYIKGQPEGVKTGFIDLDYRWGGLKPGCSYLIAARPAMGKTSLALNMIQHMALKENHKILYFSLEASTEQLVNRLLSIDSKVMIKGTQNTHLSEEQWDKITASAEKLGNSNIIVNDTPGISIEALEQEIAKDNMEGVEVVFIDYLQLLNTEHNKNNAVGKTKYLSQQLKKIAEKHRVAIVVLSQLTRRPELRVNHRPVIYDFSDTEIVKYYDNVSFIYRDEYYNRETELRNVAEIRTVHNKFGSASVVNLAWFPEYQRFCNLEREDVWEDETL